MHKISIDAGFSCPNRDGKISSDGCLYCDNRGFSFNSRLPPRPVDEQIREGIGFLKKRFKAEKFFAYFQAYTNTYAPLDALRQVYDKIKQFDEVIGLCVATRPDCVNEAVLDLLASYSKKYEVWLEYGLQSMHDETLRLINRGHNYGDFLKAIALTRRNKGIKICAHAIIGLPGESEEMIIATARALGSLRPEGVKIHPLHVLKGTGLERMFKKGDYSPLEMERYAQLAVRFLECLHPQTIIQRLSADCPEDFLVAPEWILDKNTVLKTIEDKLAGENSFQGRLYR